VSATLRTTPSVGTHTGREWLRASRWRTRTVATVTAPLIVRRAVTFERLEIAVAEGSARIAAGRHRRPRGRRRRHAAITDVDAALSP
jgi:hypothetical protein